MDKRLCLAISILLEIASRGPDGKPATTQELANDLGASKTVTESILILLSRNGFIRARRAIGYQMAISPELITVHQVNKTVSSSNKKPFKSNVWAERIRSEEMTTTLYDLLTEMKYEEIVQ